MTRRERFLLSLLGWAAAGVVVLGGVQAYLDQLSQLDARFAALQTQAVQMQTKLAQAPVQGDSAVTQRFWSEGALPEPVALARTVKPVFDTFGVAIQEFQVVAATSKEFTLKYSFKTPMAPFLRAFGALKASDPKLIVRKFSAILQERGVYLIEWEVGYAVFP